MSFWLIASIVFFILWALKLASITWFLVLLGIMFLSMFHFGRMIVVVLIGLIYWPLNWIVVNFGAKVNGLKYTDKGLFYFLWVLFSPIWLLTTLISVPYEADLEKAH